MRNAGRVMLVLAVAMPVAGRAVAAEKMGCCCVAAAGGQICTQTTEKECLAKQQTVPEYQHKGAYEGALEKSEQDESGKMKSGWTEGPCPHR
jgi:hypothetical protein